MSWWVSCPQAHYAAFTAAHQYPEITTEAIQGRQKYYRRNRERGEVGLSARRMFYRQSSTNRLHLSGRETRLERRFQLRIWHRLPQLRCLRDVIGQEQG